jgi:hypothetical protein
LFRNSNQLKGERKRKKGKRVVKRNGKNNKTNWKKVMKNIR